MPLMVHLTDVDHVRSIERAGLKRRRFRFRDDGVDGAVFAMPILPNYWVSHQWLRELRRRGRRLLVGVDFRLGAREKVLVGHYGGDHRLLPVGEATRVLLDQADPRGWEMLVPRDIAPSEIVRVRELPQVVGWRFSPGAKGRKPCGCDFCQRGDINARRIRARHGFPPPPRTAPTGRELVARLAAASAEEEIAGALDALAGARRVRGPEAFRLLLGLAARPERRLARDAAELLLRHWRWSAVPRLRDSAIPEVRRLVDDWLEERQP